MRIHHATAKKAAKFKIDLVVEDNEVVATSKDGTRLASGLQGNKVLEDAITKLTGHPAKKSVAKADKGFVAKSAKAAKKARRAKMSAKEKACRDAGYVRTRGGFKQEGDEEVSSEAKNWDELYVELVEAGDIEADIQSGFKAKYKEKYRATQGRCGDELGEKITEHCVVQGDDGKPRTGKRELERFAKANDCWSPSYSSLTTKSGAWNAGSARASVANRLRAKIRHAKKDGGEYKIDWA